MHPAQYNRLCESPALLPNSERGESLAPSTPIRARSRAPRAPPQEPAETVEPRNGFALLASKAAAAAVGLSLPAFWKQVRDGRLPRPLYPSPRSPRWVLTELHQALLQTRALPAEQLAKRRAALRIEQQDAV